MITSPRCPCCDSNSTTPSQTEYAGEQFGSVLLTVTTCQNCGYRHTDVTTLATHEPIVLSAKIASLEDLNMRVIKSGTATVSIPEFGATVTPGPYSEGYILNIEGVLTKIEDALILMLSSAKGKSLQRGERMLKRIRAAKERKPSFTFVLQDPFGNSALISPKVGKVKKRRLTKSELAKIKFGDNTLMQTSVL